MVGWHMGYADFPTAIDLNTFRRLPWEDNTPFFLMDFTNEKGERLEICPRNVLKNTLGAPQSILLQSCVPLLSSLSPFLSRFLPLM